jgi:adenylylsulfate kinase-like enzyme
MKSLPQTSRVVLCLDWKSSRGQKRAPRALFAKSLWCGNLALRNDMELKHELSKSVVTVMTSLAGCGKTMLASIFCAACVKRGEKVLVLSSTDVDIRQLYSLLRKPKG